MILEKHSRPTRRTGRTNNYTSRSKKDEGEKVLQPLFNFRKVFQRLACVGKEDPNMALRLRTVLTGDFHLTYYIWQRRPSSNARYVGSLFDCPTDLKSASALAHQFLEIVFRQTSCNIRATGSRS